MEQWVIAGLRVGHDFLNSWGLGNQSELLWAESSLVPWTNHLEIYTIYPRVLRI